MPETDHIALLIQSAQEAYSTGDMNRALDCCNDAIALDQTYLKAFVMRGMLLQATQNHQAAVADFNAVIAATKSKQYLVIALYGRAYSKKYIGELHECIADCTSALEIDPEHYDTRFLLCTSLKAIGDNDQAIVEANRLIAACPDYHEAFYTRATLLHMNADWQAAILDFTIYLDKADSADELRFDCHFMRGLSYHYLNSNNEALNDLNCALQLQPNNASALARRSLVYSKLGRTAEATNDIERAKQLLDST